MFYAQIIPYIPHVIHNMQKDMLTGNCVWTGSQVTLDFDFIDRKYLVMEHNISGIRLYIYTHIYII